MKSKRWMSVNWRLRAGWSGVQVASGARGFSLPQNV